MYDAIILQRVATSERRKRPKQSIQGCVVTNLDNNKYISMWGLRRFCLYYAVILTLLSARPTNAWDWEGYLGSNDDIEAFQTQTLGLTEIREMRVRDIKRRLTRTHGYSADEVGRMIDKEELIRALSFEEHKEREKELERVKRYVIVKGILVTLIAIAVVLFWPLWVQMYEVASVNLAVYKDKKSYEAKRCFELGSFEGMVGVLSMFLVDMLRIWLSVSILLSWVMSSKYFFPTPNLSVRPAQFMGEKVASGPLSKYGLNVGPMVLSYGFQFLQNQLEKFTGRALSRAYQKQKKASRDWESPEERAVRKAARKAAKKAAREEAEKQRSEAEQLERNRRKEVAAKASAALFSPTSEEEQKRRREEKELHEALFPHLKDEVGDAQDKGEAPEIQMQELD